MTSCDLYWYVKDTINIPIPKSEHDTYSSKTNTFVAGVSKETAVENDRRMIVPIPDHEYFVWVERLEKE
ncbi:hypothetical protein [Bacillus sp. D386]|uniref:hypothetical protein n=1 Tax=Bacillus sp. D386 TaxID=2587155 RepID=UPI00111F0242|nr:hypothetical protein [Bacillus sp. D386]